MWLTFDRLASRIICKLLLSFAKSLAIRAHVPANIVDKGSFCIITSQWWPAFMLNVTVWKSLRGTNKSVFCGDYDTSYGHRSSGQILFCKILPLHNIACIVLITMHYCWLIFYVCVELWTSLDDVHSAIKNNRWIRYNNAWCDARWYKL